MEDSQFVALLWTTLAAFLTLATFSFLYKDNPFYKFAEHLVVGVGAGFFTVLLFWTSLEDKLVLPLVAGDWWYAFPGILGILMWFRFSKKLSWVSRYSIAFYIGTSGVGIPLFMYNNVNRQLTATLDLTLGLGSLTQVWNIIIVVGVLTGLIYFFFSKEHKGLFGGAARIGIFILMIGFGASFGYTVMARVSLFVNRVIFLEGWANMLSNYLFG